ncbi:hypothetical protein [Hungatella effluvii]|uniref:hypothetical protein n=1 Tax=Hungatella effluvii TaxID=1096246 RepID=UPI0022E0278E|nr:hypothetical protein [Hungatella effluvii]
MADKMQIARLDGIVMGYSLGQRVGLYNKIRRVSISNVINTDNAYTVYKEGIPFLEVMVPRCDWNPFNTAYIFMSYLCIGLGENVYFISVETGEVKRACVPLYFGYFCKYKERLYVASGEKLYCFNYACELVWISGSIAVDGITIINITDNGIEVSCEMDPPGGWVNRILSLEDGQQISIRQIP